MPAAGFWATDNDVGLAQQVERLTVAEYLERERTAPLKSEFFAGEVFAMASGSPQHSLVATNLAAEFRRQLKGRGCFVFNSDLRVKVESSGLWTYPDLTIVCGRLRLAEEDPESVVNPTVLAEVLSDSTESYDRGAKFRNYVQIPTLQEYVLVSQSEPRIEQFVRQAGGPWLWSEATGLGATSEVSSLGVRIALAEVYADVEFGRAPLRRQTTLPSTEPS